METRCTVISLVPFLLCSYRTYEEWKRRWSWSWLGDLESSYRTYEEWKLDRIAFAIQR